MSDAAVCFVVLGVLIAMFVWNRVAPEIVAVAAALALLAAGVLDEHQVFSGFGDPVVPFLAGLFVVAEGLDASGVTGWAGRQLTARAGGPSRLVVLVLSLAAALAALITANGAVAALVPMAVLAAMRLERPASRLLMPLAFAASAGSLLILTGSPVNVLVSEALAGGFGFFSFTAVGLPLVAGTIALCAALGPRLIPERRALAMTPDLSRHARTLADQYSLEEGLLAGSGETAGGLLTGEAGAAEVVVPPRSELIGASVFPGMVTSSGDLIVLGVQRRGENLGTGESVLHAGDAMLLRGTWSALDEKLQDPGVLVVDEPRLVRRQAVPLGPGSRPAIAVLAVMVALLASGVVPAAVASVLAAGAMVVLRVIPLEQAYRSVSWTTVILIGAMIAVSTAVKESGAAGQIADGLVDLVGDAGPHALLAALFVLTATFGQLISNTATALIVIPIALSAAKDLAVSPRPVLMCVAVAAAASFLTPVATPPNLMVMGPGGYRFGDYWRMGLVLVVLFFVVATFLVPVLWRF